jgi:hypothetical protein
MGGGPACRRGLDPRSLRPETMDLKPVLTSGCDLSSPCNLQADGDIMCPEGALAGSIRGSSPATN